MSEEMGIQSPKENFAEWYLEVVRKCGVVDQRYPVKGFPVYLPNGMFMIKKITSMLEEELEKRGHEPYNFPVLIPEENLEKEKEHVKGFEKEVFWVTHAGLDKLDRKLFLRPTSETAIYPMFSLWIQSWKDLPLRLYQSVQVYRYETKMTKPLIRGREFFWIETHTAHRSWEDAEKQTRDDMEVTEKVLGEIGIPFKVLQRPEWDKFPGADHSYAYDTVLPDGKILQIATTHHLGQKFSRAFGIQFENESEEKEYAYQTCFGPGVSRFVAAAISIHGDDRGLVLPSVLARIQAVVVPIVKKGEEQKVMRYAEEVYAKLDVRKRLDDRDLSPGFKFNEWEMLGVPVRIEVGPREAEERTVTLVSRLGRRVTVGIGKLNESVSEMLDSLDNELRKRARERFLSFVSEALTLDELKAKRGLVKIGICSLEDGRECAEKIKEETGFEVRGKEVGSDEKRMCVACGREGIAVWAGRPY